MSKPTKGEMRNRYLNVLGSMDGEYAPRTERDIAEDKRLDDAILVLIESTDKRPEVDEEVVKRMAFKINRGVQDGMADEWVKNWLCVLLEEAGVRVKEEK